MRLLRLALSPEEYEGAIDDAMHEINMRWGVALDDTDQPDTEDMNQVMVRETAKAIVSGLAVVREDAAQADWDGDVAQKGSGDEL